VTTIPHPLTAICAPEDVEHSVGRRREAQAVARGGGGAGCEAVDALEATDAQKYDDDEQPADTGHRV
jgi:hypothetical protein